MSCPVDHSSSEAWANISSSHPDAKHSHPLPPGHPPLPTERETSSIPRTGEGEKWVYPSQAQFYAAMARKNHDPQERDMKVLVPIHNAVNERAWAEVMAWEKGKGGEKCGGVKLVSFKGSARERTWRARWRILLGYQPPFDRHDWVVDRCGTRMRYIIDFYTGKASTPASAANSTEPNLSFYLDVRPSIDNWEGIKMRTERFWGRWFGSETRDMSGAEQR